MLSIVDVCPGLRMTGKDQPAGQDRSRNWSAENLSTTLRCGVSHHGICSLTDYTQPVPCKDKLSQRAPLPLFDGVCPPVLYSRTFSKVQGIKMCCRSLPYNTWETFPPVKSFCFSWHSSHSTHGASCSIPQKDPKRTSSPVISQTLTVAELSKFIARFPSGVVSSIKTCQYLLMNM